jgi:hypothetical protein
LCGRNEYNIIKEIEQMKYGLVFLLKIAKGAKSNEKSIAFGSADEKYQCQDITPHSELLFKIVLKNKTSPSGHKILFQKNESTIIENPKGETKNLNQLQIIWKVHQSKFRKINLSFWRKLRKEKLEKSTQTILL